MGLKEPTQMEERIEYFNKYLNNDREFFARARKAVLPKAISLRSTWIHVTDLYTYKLTKIIQNGTI